MSPSIAPFFFFNDTATTEIYTLSLHDALPISGPQYACRIARLGSLPPLSRYGASAAPSATPSSAAAGCTKIWSDRKSTRLNSSHGYISYAVFCLKKKKNTRGARRSTVLNED